MFLGQMWPHVITVHIGPNGLPMGLPRNSLSEIYKWIALKFPRGCLEIASGLVKSLILFILETSGLQAHFQGLAS